MAVACCGHLRGLSGSVVNHLCLVQAHSPPPQRCQRGGHYAVLLPVPVHSILPVGLDRRRVVDFLPQHVVGRDHGVDRAVELFDLHVAADDGAFYVNHTFALARDLALDDGGAPHQTTEDGYETMTTQQGVPIADDQNHLKAGARGPMLTEDFIFREKMFHFDHERIPERVVHARGYGAHGYFETLDTLEDITTADIFQRKGEKTNVFARFSTVAGNKGSPDLARDVRGFAVKFYTKEGNWDLVGNNIPVFFIQDAIKFPDLIHAAKPAPACQCAGQPLHAVRPASPSSSPSSSPLPQASPASSPAPATARRGG